MSDEIIFLGTGTSQGVPVIGCSCSVCRSEDPRDKRLRTSALVRCRGLELVIDAGPDFRTQMLREGIVLPDAILLTHAHIDHIGGLDDVRAFNYRPSDGYSAEHPFPVYCEADVQKGLRRSFYYAFQSLRYPGIPKFDLRTIDDRPFRIDGVEIVPLRAYHAKLPVLGFRFGPLAYITDANRLPEETFRKLEGVRLLVLNTVRRTRHISHFSLPEAIEVARRVGAEQTFLTHLSHQLPTHEELCAELPEGILPAYDGLRVQF